MDFLHNVMIESCAWLGGFDGNCFNFFLLGFAVRGRLCISVY